MHKKRKFDEMDFMDVDDQPRKKFVSERSASVPTELPKVNVNTLLDNRSIWSYSPTPSECNPGININTPEKLVYEVFSQDKSYYSKGEVLNLLVCLIKMKNSNVDKNNNLLYPDPPFYIG